MSFSLFWGSLLVLTTAPLPLSSTAPLCSLLCWLLALGFVLLSAKTTWAATIGEGISRAPKPSAHAQDENEKNRVGNRPGTHGHLADGAVVDQPVKEQNQRAPDRLVAGEEVLELQDLQGASQVFKHLVVVVSSEFHGPLEHVAEGELGNVRGAVEQRRKVTVVEAPVRGNVQDSMEDVGEERFKELLPPAGYALRLNNRA